MTDHLTDDEPDELAPPEGVRQMPDPCSIYEAIERQVLPSTGVPPEYIDLDDPPYSEARFWRLRADLNSDE